MFGSMALEIVIGLTFLYLALSLICSALAEYGSGILKRRGGHLREAISYFFNTDDPNGARLFEAFFNQGLIRGLDPTSWKKPAQAPDKIKPNYISDNTFADVIVDLLTRGEALFAPAGTTAAAVPGVDALRAARENEVALARLGTEVGTFFTALRGAIALVPDAALQSQFFTLLANREAEVKKAAAAVVTSDAAWVPIKDMLAAIAGGVAALPEGQPKAAIAALVQRETDRLRSVKENVVTVHRVREAVAALPLSELKSALLPLMDEENEDLDKIKTNIMSWYNDVMDRVAGHYKRWTHLVLLGVALVVAVFFNADTVVIANRLAMEPALRATVVDQAARASQVAGKDSGERAETFKNDLTRLTGLPLGWKSGEFSALISESGRHGLSAANPLIVKVIGLLITTLALTMGAPFWFDMLNTLVNIRSAGKPPEKTTD